MRERAQTAGVSRRSVERDLNATNAHSDDTPTVTNSRGQQRPATYTRTDDDDVIDAESASKYEWNPLPPQEGGYGEVAGHSSRPLEW